MPDSSLRTITTARRVVPVAEPNGYRRLHETDGEPHRERRDLAPDAETDAPARRLARLVHLTDFQLADLASPSRVEFLQRLTEPEWARMLPAYRPQEFLLSHALEAIVRTIRALVESAPGEWDLAITTGDNTDTAQRNELDAYLTLMNGGAVDPAFGTDGFRDAPVLSGDAGYWNPEPESRDDWKRDLGLPDHRGAVAAAAEPFTGVGLGLPWLSSFGNHDCLVQGRAAAPEGYDRMLQAGRKPVAVPSDVPAGDKLDAYVHDPRWVSAGSSRPIRARDDRRMVSRQEYVEAHLRSTGLPAGHGFTPENAQEGTAYYIYDELPGIRIITLDSTNPAGHVDGSLDEAQFAWLRDRLRETDVDASSPASGRLVILCSHHGLSTMVNATGDERGRRYLATDVEELLHRHPQVVLWLSGHTHVNRITPRPRPSGGGFWEVSTSSIAEWPVQVRTLAVDVTGDTVRIRTTMFDADVPTRPGEGTSLEALASLHREVAANDPGSVGGLHAEGGPQDRNVDLLISLPAGYGRRIPE